MVSGQDKVIITACTPSQSTYEGSVIGYGLFTHALLQGPKGGEIGAGRDDGFVAL